MSNRDLWRIVFAVSSLAWSLSARSADYDLGGVNVSVTRDDYETAPEGGHAMVCVGQSPDAIAKSRKYADSLGYGFAVRSPGYGANASNPYGWHVGCFEMVRVNGVMCYSNSNSNGRVIAEGYLPEPVSDPYKLEVAAPSRAYFSPERTTVIAGSYSGVRQAAYVDAPRYVSAPVQYSQPAYFQPSGSYGQQCTTCAGGQCAGGQCASGQCTSGCPNGQCGQQQFTYRSW